MTKSEHITAEQLPEVVSARLTSAMSASGTKSKDARKDINFSIDPGKFILTGRALPPRPLHYGLDAPTKTLGDHLKDARKARKFDGFYGPDWQAEFTDAIMLVRGNGPSQHPEHEGPSIEPRANKFLTAKEYPTRPGVNFRPAKAITITRRLRLFNGPPAPNGRPL